MPNLLLDTIPSRLKLEKLPDDTPLKLVEVKGETFTMGNNNSTLGWGKPIHSVQVKDFWISQYSITNYQYANFLNDYGSDQVRQGAFKGQTMIFAHRWGCQKDSTCWQSVSGFEKHPVISVTWHGAHEFCNWLSTKTNKNYSLPSEAQWEYAARGGQESLGFPYAGSHKLKEVAWHPGNSHSEPKAVGLKKANELGLFDMTGNVWEWCEDHWHNSYDGAPAHDSPWLDAKKMTNPAAFRVIRGGSWGNSYFFRVADRNRTSAHNRKNDIGFRVVRY